MPASEETHELPWGEAQWEAFMERQDIRSAKFGELLSTFMDDPNCDEIIAREMGWDMEVDEETAAMWEQAEREVAAISEEKWKETERRHRADLHAIPGYSRGYAYGLRVHRALMPFIEGKDFDYDDDHIVALRDSMVIAAKIAGAHGMGYEDDVLCGNIVNCKRSLAAADRCLAALQLLRQRDVVPASVLDPLIEEGKEVRDLVEQHITGLRSRVWWE